MAGCITVIDWVATGAMMQGFGTIGGAIAVFWGAWRATDAWKEQKRLERRQEVADRILTATYKAKSALSYIRSFMLHGHELAAASELLEKDEDYQLQLAAKQKRIVSAQVYYTRIANTRKDQLALEECLPLARALFGEEIEKAASDLLHQFWIVQVNANSYVDDWNGNDQNFTKSIRRALTEADATPGEANEVSEKIATAVATIERVCVPALKLDSI